MVTVVVDPFPDNGSLNALWRAAWNSDEDRDFSNVLARSLTHIGAYEDNLLIGFVNVAGDGGLHAFILDTCVHPAKRHAGIATAIVGRAAQVAKDRGAHWLHVDFEPSLRSFYTVCGFHPTEAGLMKL